MSNAVNLALLQSQIQSTAGAIPVLNEKGKNILVLCFGHCLFNIYTKNIHCLFIYKNYLLIPLFYMFSHSIVVSLFLGPGLTLLCSHFCSHIRQKQHTCTEGQQKRNFCTVSLALGVNHCVLGYCPHSVIKLGITQICNKTLLVHNNRSSTLIEYNILATVGV